MTVGKIDVLKKLYDDVIIVKDTQNINEWAEEDRKELKREFEELQRKWAKHPTKVRGLIEQK